MTERDSPVLDAELLLRLREALERDLHARYGPMIGQDDLRQALGYPSLDAFRQALSRRQLPVPVFTLPNRRGKYALIRDVAQWLANARSRAVLPAGDQFPHQDSIPGVPP